MAFVQTELTPVGSNQVGVPYSDLISTPFPLAASTFFMYRNSAGDDVTAANFFDTSDLALAPVGLVWVPAGGDTPVASGSVLYTWDVAAGVVTLVAVATVV